MLRYAVLRLLGMIPTLIAISALVFVVIQAPEGDYLSNQIRELRAQGEAAGVARAEFLVREHHLDRPMVERYAIWLGVWPGVRGFSGLLQGDFGWSFAFDRPVAEVVGEGLLNTVLLNLGVVLFIYALAFPIGVLAAVRPHGIADRGLTFVGYLGLAVPHFLIALIALVYANAAFGVSIGGLYDPRFAGAPMSVEKAGSMAAHLILPVAIIGLGGMAASARRLRANLMDELGKPYVAAARARGLAGPGLILRYPVRAALNPFVADIGDLLPSLVSGSVIVSVVLSLPTVGPVLITALKTEDVYLSGFILMFAAGLTLIGMLISDLLLAALDPRVRLGQGRGR